MLIVLATVVIVAGIVGAVLLNQVHYTVLYSGLDAGEAGTIKTLLDGKGVTSQVQGNTILVPEDKADTLRIELASQGYPNTGLNYNIFSSSSSISSTDLDRRTYLQYQLQENIRATLRHMEKVQDCIVIVNLASDSSFVISENNSAASIAVELNLKNGDTLTNTEARSIQEFVLKCVPNLKPENVSIVDSKMHYYNIGDSAGDTSALEYSTSQQQLTEQVKDVLAKQAKAVLEPALGTGNVAVSVNLNLDFDKQTVSKVEFTPPLEGDTTGLIRSSEEIDNGSSTNANANGVAGTNTNGSGTPAYVAPSASPTGSTDNGSTKTYNYELNEVKTEIDKAQGAIQNLTVAVLVNSNVKDVSGYVDNIKNLVAKSIGVKSDYISVELMPFVANDTMASAFQQTQQTADKLSQRKTIVSIIEIVAIIAGIIIIARLFLKRPERGAQLERAVAGGGRAVVGVTAGDMMGAPNEESYDLTDLVLKKSSEAEKIEELMDRYPETVAQILRTWLAEDN